jgi:octaprenyl-diphosphate synthase
VLDYEGDAAEIGKNLGDDLAEGKMTLPLIRALATGTPEDAATIRHAVAGGGRTDFAQVLGVLARSGSLAYAHERALAEARAAADCLAGLPVSPHAQCLRQLTTFAADRTF